MRFFILISMFLGLQMEVLAKPNVSVTAKSQSPSLEAPAHGDFDFRQLFGRYRFVACENAGWPIWQTDPDNQYISISDNPYDLQNPEENYLAAALFHEPHSPIVPIWEMEEIGLGPVRTIDPQTGELRRQIESYATVSGVYSKIEWHYGEDSGWATFDIRKSGEGQLSYEMNRFDALSGNSRHETCRLIQEGHIR